MLLASGVQFAGKLNSGMLQVGDRVLSSLITRSLRDFIRFDAE